MNEQLCLFDYLPYFLVDGRALPLCQFIGGGGGGGEDVYKP